MNCLFCGIELSGRKTKFCSKKCKISYYGRCVGGKYNTKQSRDRDKKSSIIKQILINKKGGKCEKCGYDKNIAALQFHHLRDKKFELTSRNLLLKTHEEIENELNKCVLLCANCHAEEHHPNMGTKNTFELIEQMGLQSEQELLEKLTKNKNNNESKKNNYCIDCGKIISNGNHARCVECNNKNRRLVERPSKDVLRNLILNHSKTYISKMFNVSRTTIRDWCKKYGLPTTIKEIENENNGC